MGAPSDTNLHTFIKAQLSFLYKRTDITLNAAKITDNLRYSKLNQDLTNGAGANKANLLYYSTRRLINSTEVFNLDNLTNLWGQTLNYDAVKVLLIRNNETVANRFLEVYFKNEVYYIGPSGSRLVIEPFGGGIEAIVSSASSEEGALTVSSNADITYDIIIAGSHAESSSSSGL